MPGARRPNSKPEEIDHVDVAARLRVANARLTRVLRQNDGTGLGPTLIAALATVAREGPLTLGELAAAEQVAPPTITKVAGKLVDEGLAVRRIDEADRRIVRLEVTDAGIRQLEANREKRTTWLAERLERCTPEELACLSAAADVIEHLVARPEDESA
jgi:DNA-binding MarR family transcriptional regulator